MWNFLPCDGRLVFIRISIQMNEIKKKIGANILRFQRVRTRKISKRVLPQTIKCFYNTLCYVACCGFTLGVTIGRFTAFEFLADRNSFTAFVARLRAEKLCTFHPSKCTKRWKIFLKFMATRWERRDERKREREWYKRRNGKRKGGKNEIEWEIQFISCFVNYNTQWSLVISILRCRTEETKFIITLYGIFKILLHNISFSFVNYAIVLNLSWKKNFNLVIEDEEYFFPPSMKVPRLFYCGRQWSRNIELDLTHLLINVQVYPTVSIVKLKRGFIRL